MLTKRNLWPEMTLRKDFERLFDGLIGTRFGEPFGESFGAWGPAVDVHEDPERVSIEVDLPGMTRKDIKVHLENQVLTISGERRSERDETNEQGLHRRERRYGAFSRAFSLPNTVDVDKVDATYAKGVLSVKIAKRPEAQAKEIAVEVK